MGTQVLIPALCWLLLCVHASGASDNDSSVQVGNTLTEANKDISSETKKHTNLVPMQNRNGYLKDLFGNNYVETPRSLANKAGMTKQFVKLEDLPLHLSYMTKQSVKSSRFPRHELSSGTYSLRPVTNTQKIIEVPKLQFKFPPLPMKVTQPFPFMNNVKIPAASEIKTIMLKEKQKALHVSHGDGGLSTQKLIIRTPSNSPPKKITVIKSNEPPPPPLTVKPIPVPVETHPVGSSSNVGYSTVAPVESDSFDPPPNRHYLDTNLLKPLKFNNPVVPQLQHFLPKVPLNPQQQVESEEYKLSVRPQTFPQTPARQQYKQFYHQPNQIVPKPAYQEQEIPQLNYFTPNVNYNNPQTEVRDVPNDFSVQNNKYYEGFIPSSEVQHTEEYSPQSYSYDTHHNIQQSETPESVNYYNEEIPNTYVSSTPEYPEHFVSSTPPSYPESYVSPTTPRYPESFESSSPRYPENYPRHPENYISSTPSYHQGYDSSTPSYPESEVYSSDDTPEKFNDVFVKPIPSFEQYVKTFNLSPSSYSTIPKYHEGNKHVPYQAHHGLNYYQDDRNVKYKFDETNNQPQAVKYNTKTNNKYKDHKHSPKYYEEDDESISEEADSYESPDKPSQYDYNYNRPPYKEHKKNKGKDSKKPYHGFSPKDKYRNSKHTYKPHKHKPQYVHESSEEENDSDSYDESIPKHYHKEPESHPQGITPNHNHYDPTHNYNIYTHGSYASINNESRNPKPVKFYDSEERPKPKKYKPEPPIHNKPEAPSSGRHTHSSKAKPIQNPGTINNEKELMKYGGPMSKLANSNFPMTPLALKYLPTVPYGVLSNQASQLYNKFLYKPNSNYSMPDPTSLNVGQQPYNYPLNIKPKPPVTSPAPLPAFPPMVNPPVINSPVVHSPVAQPTAQSLAYQPAVHPTPIQHPVSTRQIPNYSTQYSSPFGNFFNWNKPQYYPNNYPLNLPSQSSPTYSPPQAHPLPQGPSLPQGHPLPQGQNLSQGQYFPQANSLPQGQYFPQGYTSPQGQPLPQANNLPHADSAPQSQNVGQSQRIVVADLAPDTKNTINDNTETQITNTENGNENYQKDFKETTYQIPEFDKESIETGSYDIIKLNEDNKENTNTQIPSEPYPLPESAKESLNNELSKIQNNYYKEFTEIQKNINNNINKGVDYTNQWPTFSNLSNQTSFNNFPATVPPNYNINKTLALPNIGFGPYYSPTRVFRHINNHNTRVVPPFMMSPVQYGFKPLTPFYPQYKKPVVAPQTTQPSSKTTKPPVTTSMPKESTQVTQGSSTTVTTTASTAITTKAS